MFRGAVRGDLPQILKIYDHARAAMKGSGNPTQWGDNYPPQEMLEEENGFALADDLVYAVLFESVLMRVKLISLRSRGENGNTSVGLPKNWEQANVKVYCFATSKNGKSISPSLYLAVE